MQNAQKKNAHTTEGSSKGFVMLFAVLVSSILLAIGLGIFSVTFKELLLSSSDRESQVAFYAADSGSECALYWDIVYPGYTRSIFGRVEAGPVITPAISGSGVASCAGVDINDVWQTTAGVAPIITTFDVAFENGACAKVTVTKDYDSVAGESTTVIDSRGFNTCDEGSARRAERGLRVSY